jgi:anti-sigma-K factor RskA
MTADHDDVQSDCALYVLGGLPAVERTRLEDHLRTCDACSALVRSFRTIAAVLPYAAPLVDAPSGLRDRIIAEASRARPGHLFVPRPDREADEGRRRRNLLAVAWAAAAASLFLAVGFGVVSADLRNRLQDTERRLGEAVTRLADSERRLQSSVQETTTVRRTLALLTAADVVELRFVGQAPARQAVARAFLSRSRGVLFAASNLPPIPSDRTYQVWYLTGGAPVSAGLVRPDAAGSATATFAAPTTLGFVGMAVSLEPEGGVAAPTGAIYLATQ